MLLNDDLILGGPEGRLGFEFLRLFDRLGIYLKGGIIGVLAKCTRAGFTRC